jgi:isopropylmalate/homocitrate/citramalate synthase
MARVSRDKFWTGSINTLGLERLGIDLSTKKIGLYDTTLRDGEQAVGVVLDAQQKLQIAHWLDETGVNRIEAGFPRVSEEDRLAIEMIAGAGLRAEIWGFSRAMPDDIAAIVDLGLSFTIVEAPISDLKLNALGVSHDAMIERIQKTIGVAIKNNVKVAFFGVDGSRADLAFAERVYKAAVDSGASEIVVVDTLGIATPEAVQLLIGRASDWVGGGIPIHFHGHNDFGLATACAISAVRAGATWIHGTVDGMGERAGNANLAQVSLALEGLYNATTDLKLETARGISEKLRALVGYSLEPWKPVVGENLFTRETGAVAAQFHQPEAIEPYSSEVLATPRQIVLGKKSGLASIRIKCQDLGLKIPEDQYPALLSAVKSEAIARRRLITNDEFRRMAQSGTRQS